MIKYFIKQLKYVKFKDILSFFLFLIALPCSFFMKLYKHDFWLVCERKNEARDNGYWFYKYIIEQHSDQKIIYAINKKASDFIKVKDLGKIIQFGSLKHWIYYLAASYNISSQKEGKPNAALCHFFEVFNIIKNKRVYLKHGIVHNDLKWHYYKFTKMRVYICTTKKEFDFCKANFGYPDENIFLTGLCRYDNLFNIKPIHKDILVMPTDREWLTRPVKESKQYDDISDFRNSEYYKTWNSFLHNNILEEILEKYDYNLIFYLHPNIQRERDKFNSDNKRIIIASNEKYDLSELLKNSSILITDYSSIFFDFAYMDKPLLYYQFDYKKFRKGHYSEGYFSYKDNGFGDVCENQNDLFLNLEKILLNNGQVSKFYKERADEFFTFRDNHNCERIYKVIKKINPH